MKRLLLATMVLFMTILTAVAQQQKKIDYTTYDVIAKTGSVTLVVKDNDYRLIVGSLKKPRTALPFGYAKEQVIARLNTIQEYSSEKERYGSKNRHVGFYGSTYVLNITGGGENETFSFKGVDTKGKFKVTTKDCAVLRHAIMELP